VEDWKNTVDVNLSGMFYTCQATLRGMRERKDGVIINILLGRAASPPTLPVLLTRRPSGQTSH
jgi:NADP-dependent 3-hydroxy acid dehydrogenase YdfG